MICFMEATRQRITSHNLMNKVAASKGDTARQLDGAPEYDKDQVAHLISILSYLNASITGVRGAIDDLSSIPWDSISPDGKLGGRGFVMPVPDFMDSLSEVFSTLTKLKSTVADEFNNPGWGLSKEEKQQILTFQEQASDNTQGALTEVDNSIGQMFSDSDQGTEGENDTSEKDTPENEDFPEIGSLGDDTTEQTAAPEPQTKTASYKPVFVGFSGKEPKMAQQLAEHVLKGLVKMASEESQQQKKG